MSDEMDRILNAATVPSELLPPEADPNARVTYDGLMDLLNRVYENPYGDQIEAARWPDETRAEAKRRIMRGVYEADMRAKYHMRPREFVQTDGKPYHTDNWGHFLNRYSAGVNVPTYMIGVYKDTPRVMMVEAAKERDAVVTLRILSDQ